MNMNMHVQSTCERVYTCIYMYMYIVHVNVNKMYIIHVNM